MDRPPWTETTTLAGNAHISRSAAYGLTTTFLLLIVLPAAHQTLNRPHIQAERFRTLLTRLPTAASLSAFDEGLAEESRLAMAVRQGYQALVFRGLGQGNHKVTVGREGFLFLRQDIGLCAGPGLMRRGRAVGHPSLAPIEDYSARLAERGVHLVVVPVPVTPAVYPEKAWPGYPEEAGPANNADYGAWLAALDAAGVDVVDIASVYWQERSEGQKLLFLKRNTHWTPRGVVVAARAVAARVRPFLEGTSRESFETRTTSCVVESELVPMLDLPASTTFRPMRYDVTGVLRGGAVAAGDDDAPVVLLGDSLSRMFSGADPGCGGGGFAQHLMLALGAPVQSLAIIGADPTEIRLKLAERKGALRGKRVLVWEFTTRYLLEYHDPAWRTAPLPYE